MMTSTVEPVEPSIEVLDFNSASADHTKEMQATPRNGEGASAPLESLKITQCMPGLTYPDLYREEVTERLPCVYKRYPALAPSGFCVSLAFNTDKLILADVSGAMLARHARAN